MPDPVVTAPLAVEFAQRMHTAGITPDNPAIEFIRHWNPVAYRRAGAIQCLCPHLALNHHLTTGGQRTHCLVIGPGGVRCGCAEFTEAEGGT